MTVLRKNAAHLTDAEWSAFCNALLAMKKVGVYDDFISRHAMATRTNGAIIAAPGNTQFKAELEDTNGAHRGPAFIIWHRAMLLEFEAQVQQYIDSSFKSLGIPYWDWTQDPTGKSVFNKYLGTTIGEVKDGLFNAPDWSAELNPNAPGTISFGPLRRAMGQQTTPMPDMATTMPPVMASEVYDSFDSTNYDKSFRRNLERKLHDIIHVWVGGPMRNPLLAPNDPVFYMHHANIDRLFTRWQEMHPSVSPYFQDPNVIMPAGQNYADTLLQLKSTPQQVWDYKQLGYTYERSNTIRRCAGVDYNTLPPPIGEPSPVSVKFSTGTKVPPSATAMQVGFTGWNMWFQDTDHQLLRLTFDCNQPPYAGPIPSSIQGQMELRDAVENRLINVQPQVSKLLLTDSSTFGALLVGRQTLSVPVSGNGERDWSATLTAPQGAEFAMAFFSGIDMRYADASHWIFSEAAYIEPMPLDSVPKQVTGKVHLWDNSGHQEISAKLTVEVLYFSTKVLSSNLNYVLSGAIDKSISIPPTDAPLTANTPLVVPEATILTIPAVVGLSWMFLDSDHNLRGHRFALTSTLSQLNYTGYLWDDGQDDYWEGGVHALVLCFSPYWL